MWYIKYLQRYVLIEICLVKRSAVIIVKGHMNSCRQKPFTAGSSPLGTSFSPVADTVSTHNDNDKTNFFSTVHLFPTKAADAFCFKFCAQTGTQLKCPPQGYFAPVVVSNK